MPLNLFGHSSGYPNPGTQPTSIFARLAPVLAGLINPGLGLAVGGGLAAYKGIGALRGLIDRNQNPWQVNAAGGGTPSFGGQPAIDPSAGVQTPGGPYFPPTTTYLDGSAPPPPPPVNSAGTASQQAGNAQANFQAWFNDLTNKSFQVQNRPDEIARSTGNGFRIAPNASLNPASIQALLASINGGRA